MPTLTEARLAKLEPPEKGRRLVFDDHKEAPKGFGIRVTSGGKKAFVLRYQSKQGKDRLMTIGDYGTWSLAAARKRAGEFRQEIDGGTDILEQRREERAQATVREALERFLKSKAGIRSLASVRGLMENHLASALGDRKIRDIRKHHLIEVVEDVASTHGRTAALLLTYTKQLFGWAEDRGLVEVDVSAGIKPRKVASSLAPKRRDRILTDGEMRALWTREGPPEGMHPMTLLVLRMILITGQRPGEVAGMKWSEVHGDIWTIPANRRGKTETAHTVPLTGTARTLLDQAAQTNESRAFVFATRGDRAPGTAAIAKAVLRCADELGMELETRWRPHDLRRTMRTGLAAARVPEHIAELAIGHTRKGMAAVYDLHRYDDEKRAAMEAWERRMLGIVGPEVPAEVVHIHGGPRYA
ncbi:integrase [Thioalkalivibrio versutus]|uniref:Integrase n=1 Tax=Thioalkalivibrio versutus TaxID=106634 RepID=A0A0G3G3Q8_9GAMM|nr:site-specific integrase [Thioalkalivibrio versutus]AKJ95049.1 integrase [Thioalkalivibrio versutus]